VSIQLLKKTEKAEAGSGKILKVAVAFWQNKLEAEANSEATNFIQSQKRKQKSPKSEEAEANLEAWDFKRSWKRKQKIFYCFHISARWWWFCKVRLFNHRKYKIVVQIYMLTA